MATKKSTQAAPAASVNVLADTFSIDQLASNAQVWSAITSCTHCRAIRWLAVSKSKFFPSCCDEVSCITNLTTKRAQRDFFDQTERIVPWASLVDLVVAYAPEGKEGRPPSAVETYCQRHRSKTLERLHPARLKEIRLCAVD